MNRLIASLAAVLLTWLGILQPGDAAAEAAPDTPVAAHTYEYDGVGGFLAGNHNTDRGPPAADVRGAVYDADGLRPLGALVHSDGSASSASYDYDDRDQLVQVARAGHEALRHGISGRAKPAAVWRLRVAAKYGRDIPIGPASDDAWMVLNRVDAKGSPLPGYKGGSVYRNSDTQLPEGVTYQKWDLNQKVKGIDRDDRRLITGSDGSAYYTTDHYLSFIQIR